MYLLMCKGPNRLVIPAMAWETREQAVGFMSELMEKHPDSFVKGDKELDVGVLIRPSDQMAEEGGGAYESIFKDYYGGCGGCYKMVIQEVQPGEKLVCWDLD